MLLKILYITAAIAAGFYTGTLFGINPDTSISVGLMVFGYWLLFGFTSTIAVFRLSKNGEKLWGKILLWPLYYWFKKED